MIAAGAHVIILLLVFIMKRVAKPILIAFLIVGLIDAQVSRFETLRCLIEGIYSNVAFGDSGCYRLRIEQVILIILQFLPMLQPKVHAQLIELGIRNVI